MDILDAIYIAQKWSAAVIVIGGFLLAALVLAGWKLRD